MVHGVDPPLLPLIRTKTAQFELIMKIGQIFLHSHIGRRERSLLPFDPSWNAQLRSTVRDDFHALAYTGFIVNKDEHSDGLFYFPPKLPHRNLK
jgi:hypothetical protein